MTRGTMVGVGVRVVGVVTAVPDIFEGDGIVDGGGSAWCCF